MSRTLRTAVVPFALAQNMPKDSAVWRVWDELRQRGMGACTGRGKCKRVPRNLRRHLVSINATANRRQECCSACPKQTLIAYH